MLGAHQQQQPDLHPNGSIKLPDDCVTIHSFIHVTRTCLAASPIRHVRARPPHCTYRRTGMSDARKHTSAGRQTHRVHLALQTRTPAARNDSLHENAAKHAFVHMSLICTGPKPGSRFPCPTPCHKSCCRWPFGLMPECSIDLGQGFMFSRTHSFSATKPSVPPARPMHCVGSHKDTEAPINSHMHPPGHPPAHERTITWVLGPPGAGVHHQCDSKMPHGMHRTPPARLKAQPNNGRRKKALRPAGQRGPGHRTHNAMRRDKQPWRCRLQAGRVGNRAQPTPQGQQHWAPG